MVKNRDRIEKTQRRKEALDLIESMLAENDPALRVEGAVRGLKLGESVKVLAFGKASQAMFEGARRALGGKYSRAAVVVPEGEDIWVEGHDLEVYTATHPDVSQKSVEAAQLSIEHLGPFGEGDDVLVLISGGGSAMFELPAQGLDAERIMEVSRCVMDAGGDIYELNAVRALMSRVKAGGLAVMLYPARVHGLVVSDVMGDDLSVIASGPLTMLRDTRRVEEALRKFRERCLPGVMVQQVGERSDPRYFERVEQQIVLSNSDFVQSGIRYLASRRVDFVSFGSNLRGEVSEFSRRLAQALRQAYSLRGSPFWFVCGGETTVQVRGNGRGGRAQELVLRFMEEMGDDEDFLLACFGTDGIDGRSDAAGGISDNWLRERVGRDEVERYLAGSDSGTLLMSRDSAIVTGRTGNNVSDIMVGYYGRR
ncbi:D-glycerate 2-kinase [Thermogymnomonas acidicola]|uniref:D-glycerate 2-kinase n=1 Tax=Thermogymnomonas acidicola TaxID=399579 RepID=A0AA37BRL9_9ARCH|nr:D-glycerate 2-kinase [Thermogymnomonas acidicola]